MVGLVEQLQDDAINPDVPVSTLLRKVKVAAVKLGRDDTIAWVQNELEGYKKFDDLPDYRKGSGNTVAWNPYHGWQHIDIRDAKFADLISDVAFYEPIANYESALKNENDRFSIPLSNELVAMMNETLNVRVPRISNSISRGFIIKIVERVRDLVLNWAVELQRVGITGKGLSFSADERRTAQGAHISIGSFHGSFNAGDAVGSHSQISVQTNNQANELVFDQIRQAIEASVPIGSERDTLIEATTKLSQAIDKNEFLSAYDRLVQAAANHITVLGPFLPALGHMIGSFSS